jgi:hypothetical protein
MSREPKRWLDDANAPAGVQELLRGGARARPLDEGTRVRVGKRVARLSIVPLSLLTWLGTKSALAALGAAAGIVTMGAITIVTRATQAPEAPPARSAAPAPKPRALSRPAPPATEALALEPAPAPEPPKSVTPPASRPQPAASTGLAEETAFLERARRLLATDPAFALLFVREHSTRFPRGKLGAERSLIEIEALYRSGRHAEARALAEQKLASGAGDLYSERVKALLERMDASR